MLIFGYRLKLWQSIEAGCHAVVPLPGLRLLLGYCNYTPYTGVRIRLHIS